MKTLVNPFIITGYEGGRYFCDRVNALKTCKNYKKNIS